MFFLENGEEEKDPQGHGRNDWGGKLFRYREKRYDAYHARSFHFSMAEYWIKEYHIDGFRIDEFKGIDNWDFIRDFRNHSWRVHQAAFPGRPFIVVAEDSWRRPEITQDLGRGKTVDAMWDFDFRDELRRLAGNRIYTSLGQASRLERVRAMITGNRCWDDMGKRWRQRWVGDNQWVDTGFEDMAQRVIYNTSHDVERWHEQRILPYFIDELKWDWSHWNHDQADKNLHLKALQQAHNDVLVAFEQVYATFALMLTAPGIPMFLAGEEFGDLHDIDHSNWRKKMSDPIDWRRAQDPGHKELRARVKELVWLRRRHSALHRNEVEFFGLDGDTWGFCPGFDENDGLRVFAYCRTGGQPLGSPQQVVVVANCGRHDFSEFKTDWPWGDMILAESGGSNQPLPSVVGHQAKLALRPYQVRVFTT
jgi:1,4-alpha-glucan branching enzyme